MTTSTESDTTASDALRYLLGEGALWDVRLRPESLQVMTKLWQVLEDNEAACLVKAILQGPPLSGFEDEARRRDSQIGLRLMILERGSRALPADASEVLAGIREREPGLRLSGDGRELFPVWFSTSAGRAAQPTEAEIVAMPLADLKAWLSDATGRHDSKLDAWRGVVAKNPGLGAAVLASFATEKSWPATVWHDTLLGLDAAPRKGLSFERVRRLLLAAPDDLFRDVNVGWAMGWCIPGVAKCLPMAREARFWELWDHLLPRLLQDDHSDPADRDPLGAALNQAPGRMAEALIWRWSAHNPLVGRGLPAAVEPRLTVIAAGTGNAFRVARVMLARSLSGLFANDPEWARLNLLPRFSWADPVEAAAMWRGFLAGGPIDPNLFKALKADFRDTLYNHAREVCESEDALWQVFMVACLEIPGAFNAGEARDALQQADAGARRVAAFYLYRLMPQERPDLGEAMWRERIGPWLSAEWPKDKGLRDTDVAGNIAMAAALSGAAFPEALSAIAELIVPGTGDAQLWHMLLGTDLPERFPDDVLRLVAATAAPGQPLWHYHQLPKLLDRLETAEPSVHDDARFRQLREQLAHSGVVL